MRTCEMKTMPVTKPFIDKLITPLKEQDVTPTFCSLASLSVFMETDSFSFNTAYLEKHLPPLKVNQDNLTETHKNHLTFGSAEPHLKECE